jgi:hypothetical protein
VRSKHTKLDTKTWVQFLTLLAEYPWESPSPSLPWFSQVWRVLHLCADRIQGSDACVQEGSKPQCLWGTGQVVQFIPLVRSEAVGSGGDRSTHCSRTAQC